MIKTYYLCRLTQLSPLRISNGDSNKTDSDLMRDGKGEPYIPGSSMAGVLRARFPEKDADSLFGFLSVGSSKDIRESRICVSDAKLIKDKSGSIHYTIRDGVAVDEDGTAKDKAKYDFEVAEGNCVFHAVLETDSDDPVIEKVLLGIQSEGGLSFGGHTTRGYGRMKAEFRKKQFDLSDSNVMNAWLDYDPFSGDAFDCASPIAAAAAGYENDRLFVKAEISISGSFAVRVYHDGESTETLKNHDDKPVIPGTSWAGVFRHYVRSVSRKLGLNAEETDGMFGSAGIDGDKKQRSRICFEETVLENSKTVRYVRNALDRFTMAPRNGALYTEEYCSYGNGSLEISLPRNADRTFLQLLSCALIDLDKGILHLGGEGGTGHGLVTVDRLLVDGRDVTQELKDNKMFLLQGKE